MSKRVQEKFIDPTAPVVKKGVEHHAGWVYTQRTLDIINGNQMAIIEALGLPDKQENALKSQVRQALYRPQRLAHFLTAQEMADRSDEEAETLKDLPLDINTLRNVR